MDRDKVTLLLCLSVSRNVKSLCRDSTFTLLKKSATGTMKEPCRGKSDDDALAYEVYHTYL